MEGLRTFVAICTNIMRRILIDRARATGMDKQGDAAPYANLNEARKLASDSKSVN